MIKLRDITCFIFDMDGTVYLGSQILPGAKELLAYLKERGICYRFFTNNSSRTPEDYAEKLKTMGFGIQPRVLTSGDVAADTIIRTFGNSARIYLVGTGALKRQLEQKGLICTDIDPDCVLAGFDTEYNFEKASRAVSFLREGVPYLATNIDAVCPLEGGAVLPDCASICAMLSHASGCKPQYLGKPFAQTAQYILSQTGIKAQKTAVVGDRLYTDMQLALDNGMCAVGVLSGEMTHQDIESSAYKPHYLFDNVYELYRHLL